MKINLPSASLCCMSRFYLWPLTYLKASAAAGLLTMCNAGGELSIETESSCGPGHRDSICVTEGSLI